MFNARRECLGDNLPAQDQRGRDVAPIRQSCPLPLEIRGQPV